MMERHLQVTRRLAQRGLATASLLLALGATALAQQTTGVPGSPEDDHHGQPASAAAATIPRQDWAQRWAIDAVLARTCCATQRRAEHSADYDGRYRLRRLQHVRRRHPDAQPRPDRRQRAALYQLQFNIVVLANSRRADHGAKPSFNGLRGGC